MSSPTEDPTPDDIAKRDQLKVLEIVDTIQQDCAKEERVASPVPKPRRISPATTPQDALITPPLPAQPKVSPPGSPIRRRTNNMEKGPKPPIRRRKKFQSNQNSSLDERPASSEGQQNNGEELEGEQERQEITGEQEKSNSGQDSEQEISKAPEVSDEQEISKAPEVSGEQEISKAPEVSNEQENGETLEQPRLDSGPDITIIPTEDGERKEQTEEIQIILREGSFAKTLLQSTAVEYNKPRNRDSNPDTDQSEDSSETLELQVLMREGSVTQVIPTASEFGGIPDVQIREATPEAPTGEDTSEGPKSGSHRKPVPSPRVISKKKPPPLPAPYQPKTPPLPVKKKHGSLSVKEGRMYHMPDVVERLSSVDADSTQSSPPKVAMDGGKKDSKPGPPPRPPPPKKATSEPIYAEIDETSTPPSASPGIEPSRLTSIPENYATKHMSSGSLESEWSIDIPPSPSPSLTSMESNNSPPRVRGVTVSTAAQARGVIQRRKTAPVRRNRPLSESSELLETYEVIPGSSGTLEDVMMSMREFDGRLQDANIYELIHACAKALPHITSTNELPSRIPDFPENSRSQVIHELYTTEYTYVKGLEVLSEVFKRPLAVVLGDETGSIFANVDDILAFNKGFLALLHSRLTNWKPDQCVGDIFIGMFTQSHRSMYAIYCSNYDTAEMLVHQKIKKKKEFEQQLMACFSSPLVMPGLTLQAHLITPVQRIPRYILLLRDIIKRTPDVHPDYRNLEIALQRMGELADYIDAQVRESQTKRTFESLINKVHGLVDLDSPERSLVKEGQVYLKNIKKLYQCILFNDLLVFAHGDSKQSTVELQLNLEAVWVEDLEDLDPQTTNEDAVEVYTPERPYTIYTRTSSEKRLWLPKLRETIYHHLHKEGKCLRSDRCDAETRHATFVYSDNRVYTGNYVDSRRHGKGIMTWPNKTVYVGDWEDDERSGEGEFTYNTGDVYRGGWCEDQQNGMGELQYASNDIYRGHWKNNTRHNSGKILYANGDVLDGHFVAGQLEGQGRLKCVNGVEYAGEWKHSLRHGQGTLKTITGNKYIGEFRFNHIHGQGTMLYKNGDKYEGSWKFGMRQGQGKITYQRGGSYEGTWEKDLPQGRGKMIYSNGDTYDGEWELNMRQGKGKLYYSTGEIFDGEFSSGIINGEGEMKYSKVSKYQGCWINGMRQGQGAMVYEDKSSYNGDWHQGLRHGHGEVVNADGSVYRGQWAYDKPNGKGTLSIPAANYTYSGDFVHGLREGRGEEQSQYGNYKGGWKNDMKHGHGEERSLVGTIFVGSWERNRKHGRGVRRMVFGTVEDQEWRSGQLTSDLARMTAVDLPYISRNDY